MQPSEFWQLSPGEWWWELDSKIESNRKLREITKTAKPGFGGFTGAEWDAARARHKAKMNDTAASS